MNPIPPTSPALTASIGFWSRHWQQQIEQNQKALALWAQVLPRTTARELAAEAESHKISQA